MSAFIEGQIDWARIDVQAIVGDQGIATIDESRRSPCLQWLRRNDYRIDQFDCTVGLESFVERLGMVFRWEQQFGYPLTSDKRNLDALRDGFAVDVPASGGVVIELFRPDLVWREDSGWLLGLLAIASDHSRYHLACGRRFFTLLVVPEKSPLLGQTIEQLRVPVAFWIPCDATNRFESRGDA